MFQLKSLRLSWNTVRLTRDGTIVRGSRTDTALFSQRVSLRPIERVRISSAQPFKSLQVTISFYIAFRDGLSLHMSVLLRKTDSKAR